MEAPCCFRQQNTMVFSTPFSRKSRLRQLVLGACLLVCSTLASADSIFVQSVDLTPRVGEYYLSASFNIGLTPTVKEALNRGVPLYFLVEFEVIYPRWYTLYFWNKRIVDMQQIYRLSYNALTRQYGLSYGVLNQTFDTLESALSVLGGINDQPVFDESVLDDDLVYEAQLRMLLDTSRLPKPFQIDALGSNSWDVSSSWFRWTIKR
jgi:hypothetical protein